MRWLAVCLLVLPLTGVAQEVDRQRSIEAAELTLPTLRYDHAALGDAQEWGGLRIGMITCGICAAVQRRDVVLTLPDDRVFEDVTARLANVDGMPGNEIVVVETDVQRGASLAIYGFVDGPGQDDQIGKMAGTPFIGQTHRWLAPAGIADFDGDGRIEIAYIDRPHLARELVVVRYQDGVLVEVARQAGFTNHRIGDRTIAGGVRSCAGRESLIVASGDWTRAVDVTLQGGAFVTRDLGAIAGPGDLAAFMACK